MHTACVRSERAQASRRVEADRCPDLGEESGRPQFPSRWTGGQNARPPDRPQRSLGGEAGTQPAAAPARLEAGSPRDPSRLRGEAIGARRWLCARVSRRSQRASLPVRRSDHGRRLALDPKRAPWPRRAPTARVHRRHRRPSRTYEADRRLAACVTVASKRIGARTRAGHPSKGCQPLALLQCRKGANRWP